MTEEQPSALQRPLQKHDPNTETIQEKDDLYGDLRTGVSTLEDVESTQALEKLRRQYASLQQETACLQQANAEYHTRVSVLEKNLSKLYQTAKVEIQRKDKEIATLRKKLAEASH